MSSTKMLLLLAAWMNPSMRIILLHGDEDVEVRQSHAQTIHQTVHDQSTHTCPSLNLVECPFWNVEGLISKRHHVHNQTNICRCPSHLADGLKFLSSIHIVDADLKPKNILGRADKTLVRGDLGGCHVPTTPQNTQSIQASLSYASVEIHRQTGITPAAELFSMGLIVYYLATAELPQARAWEPWCSQRPSLSIS